jgi:hypothetical protein
MDGFAFTEFLTANYHHPTGIIYMTGFQDKSSEFEAMDFSDSEVINFDFLINLFLTKAC